jgi:hypothetical protein
MFMRFDSFHNKMLKVDSIQQINDGLIVMKHFFEINKKLLPIYFDLNIKTNKTIRDYLDIDKINTVFDSYNFDVNASKVLLNSEILDYIQHAYFVIQNSSSSVSEKQNALNVFLNEYKKLKNNWEIVESN